MLLKKISGLENRISSLRSRLGEVWKTSCMVVKSLRDERLSSDPEAITEPSSDPTCSHEQRHQNQNQILQ